MAPKLQKVEVLTLGRGLNIKKSPMQAQAGDCLVAENVNRHVTGAIQKRRGNKLLFQLDSQQAVIGLFDYEFLTSSGDQIHQWLFVLDDGALWYFDANQTKPIFAGGSWDKPTGSAKFTRCSFAQTPSGEVYIAVGSGRLTVWTGTDRCYAGITPSNHRPTATLTEPLVAGEGLTGDYYYKYTYIYRTRDGRTIESNPSGKNNPVITADDDVINITWTLPDSVQGGERVNGVRIYRTFANADPDVGPYQFVTEQLGLDEIFYPDQTPDTLLTVPLAPVDHQLPPKGINELLYNQNVLFAIGSKDFLNRIHESKLGEGGPEYEHFPATGHAIDVPTNTRLVTGAVIKGVPAIFTQNQIGHVTGTDPSNFVYRVMDSSVGCIAPDSLSSIGDVLIFQAQHGFCSWDGSRSLYLSKVIEPEFESNPASNRETCLSALYNRMTHLYFPMLFPDGKVRWWVYDYDVGNTAGYGTPADSEDIKTRAWFRYSGRNGMLRATAIETLREFYSREEQVVWGTSDGKVYQFDVGVLDDAEPIDMTYRFWVLPETPDGVAPKGQMISWRFATSFFGKWAGDLAYGWGWWGGPFGSPGEVFKRKKIPRIGATNKRVRHNFSGYGNSPFLFEITHSTAGDVVYEGTEFWYRTQQRGMRGVRL